MSEELKMYIEYRDGKPCKYRYGESWRATQLLVDGGYDTPEEAKARWESEQQENRVFCLNCGEKRNYKIGCRNVKMKVRDLKFTSREYYATCDCCGREVYVPTVNDMNVAAYKNAYEEATK